jgi:hypothetical protein
VRPDTVFIRGPRPQYNAAASPWLPLLAELQPEPEPQPEPEAPEPEAAEPAGRATAVTVAAAAAVARVAKATDADPTSFDLLAQCYAEKFAWGAERLRCCGADIHQFRMSESQQASLVWLDMADNRLGDAANTEGGSDADDAARVSSACGLHVAMDGGCCWLRVLSLRGNSLRALPALPAMPRLLSLDVSHNPDLSPALHDPAATTAFAAVSLRELNLEACGLVTLPTALHTLGTEREGVSAEDDPNVVGEFAPRALATLCLAHNQIRDRGGLEVALKPFPLLRSLTLAGNPAAMQCDPAAAAASEGGIPRTDGLITRKAARTTKTFEQWVTNMARGHLNALQTLDGAPIADVMAMAAAAAAGPRGVGLPKTGGRSTQAGADAAAAVVDLRENCTCRDGTPCDSPYDCKDWIHRFAVAQKARGDPWPTPRGQPSYYDF